VKGRILNVVDLLSFSILTDGKYLMPATNQPLFRSNAMKHYMQGREKHTVPRFISLPIMILLWALLVLFLASGAFVWSEQVPMYATTQGIVVVESATQSSGKSVSATEKSVSTTEKSVSATEKSVSATEKSVSATEKSVSATGKLVSATEKSASATEKSASATGKQVPVMGKTILPTAKAVLFLPPAQVKNLHIGTPVRLHVGLSDQQPNNQITSIEPSAMSPAVLRSLFHLENYPLFITQPVAVVMVKLDPAFATAHAGSTLTADVQVGSQSLISLLPGVGSLFGK
jgi:hypothetical protein